MGFPLLYIISVLPGGFRCRCVPWGLGVFFSTLLVDILINTIASVKNRPCTTGTVVGRCQSPTRQENGFTVQM